MKIKDMRQVLDILEKYSDDGDSKSWVAGADHDIIFLELTDRDCSPDSEDGLKLIELGCHFSDENDCWCKYA